MNKAKKIPFIFRVTRSNRFTLPVLLHTLEKTRCDERFCPGYVESFRELLPWTVMDRAVIAYSFMTPHLPEVWSEVKKIRQRRKGQVLLIAGGPHPTGDPQGTLKIGFDAVICGDGETGLPMFCRAYREGESLLGRIFKSPDLSDLDESYPVSKYDRLVPPLEITRGCFYGCAFCQTRGRGPVHRSIRSVDRFLDELVRRKFVFRTGFICPSGFEYGSEKPGNPSLNAIETILSMSKFRGIRYLEYAIFPSEVRPNTVTRDLLNLIRKYCSNKKITIGAQSASDCILKREKRGHSVEDIERAAALIHEHGLRPQIDFILGFPDETEKEQMQTLEWIKKLSIRYRAWNQIHYFLPLSGTPQYHRKPAPLSERIVRLLDDYTRNGYANNWWRQGRETAQKLLRVRAGLNG